MIFAALLLPSFIMTCRQPGVNHSQAWATDPSALDTLSTTAPGNLNLVIVKPDRRRGNFVATLGGSR